MARIEKYLIRSFNNTDQAKRTNYSILVPDNSIFLNKVKVLHDGIYGFYSLSEILMASAGTRKDNFAIVTGTDSIPDDGVLIDILDVVFEVPLEEQANNINAEPTQGIMLFPIFKLK